MRNITHLPGVAVALILAAVTDIWEKGLASYDGCRAKHESFDGQKNRQRFDDTLVRLRAVHGMDVEGAGNDSRKGAGPQVLSNVRGLESANLLTSDRICGWRPSWRSC